MSEAVRCPTLKGPRWKVFASTGRWSAFHRCLPGEDTLEPMTFLFYLKSFKDPPQKYGVKETQTLQKYLAIYDPLLLAVCG